MADINVRLLNEQLLISKFMKVFFLFTGFFILVLVVMLGTWVVLHVGLSTGFRIIWDFQVALISLLAPHNIQP